MSGVKNKTTLQGFGARVKNARKRCGLSQKTLAAKLGLHISTVARIEIGQLGISLSVFVDLCRTLNADPAVILGLESLRPKYPPVKEIEALLESFRDSLIATLSLSRNETK
jgi:transcriptional regulator with XRE-family HTH domain